METSERHYPEVTIVCDCGCSILRSERWADKAWGLVCVGIYRGFGSSMLKRIRGAWMILRRGEFAMHEMILQKSDIDEMIDFLEKSKDG